MKIECTFDMCAVCRLYCRSIELHLILTNVVSLFNCLERDKTEETKIDSTAIKYTCLSFNSSFSCSNWLKQLEVGITSMENEKFYAHSRTAFFVSKHHKDLSINAINLLIWFTHHIHTSYLFISLCNYANSKSFLERKWQKEMSRKYAISSRIFK